MGHGVRHGSMYTFENRWVLNAAVDTVFDVLSDFMDYPAWWPACVEVERASDDTYRAALRSTLPFTIHYTMQHEEQDRATGVLRARLRGDIDGTAQWALRALGDGTTEALFTQNVGLTHPVGRLLSPLLHPVFEWNHSAAMAGGEKGLQRYLASRATPPPHAG